MVAPFDDSFRRHDRINLAVVQPSVIRAKPRFDKVLKVARALGVKLTAQVV